MHLVVRTTLPPSNLATSIKLALRPIDPNLPVTDFQTLQSLADKVGFAAALPRHLADS
jgi:hypothetical protein